MERHLMCGGELIVKVYIKICNHVFRSGEWPEDWSTSTVLPHPKTGNLLKCQNYRTISLISHPSKILLNALLNHLQPQAESILSEKQKGFRKDRLTTDEQIFNLRIICEKHRELGKPIFHNFIDYKSVLTKFGSVGSDA